MTNETNTDEAKNRKTGRIIATVVAVLVIIALVIGGARKKTDAPVTIGDTLPEGCKPGFLFSETTGKPCPIVDDATSATDTKPEGISSAYEAALKEYAGKLIAFDGACKQIAGIAGPIATGTRILVANNSPKQITLGVGGKTETLDGYHYFTTTLRTKGDLKVSCENKEAAMIKVQ